MQDGTIRLVDGLDRTVATLTCTDLRHAERQLRLAVSRWERFDVVGGYVHDRQGNLVTYA